MKKIKIALLQQRCSNSKQENLNRTITAIREAKEKGAQLICLQELHTSLYFCQQEAPSFFDLAETIPGATTDQLSALAKELELVIVSSVFEKRSAGLYHNTAVVLDRNGEISGKYRKMHIPDDPGYYEKYYFTPGDLGFVPINTSLGKLGVLICWDQWYPEAARLMALAGAEILIYPTAIGWDINDEKAEQERQLNAWLNVQKGHAVANGLHLIAVNRVGLESSIDRQSGQLFWGNSFVAGPQGELVAQASPDKEEVLVVEIDLSRSETVRRSWPFLRDRRIDSYGDLLQRFRD